MLRVSDVIGLPVLVDQSYRRIGRVREVLIHRDGSGLCGLVLEDGGWLHERRVLDFRGVRHVTETHVIAAERYLDEESQTCCCRDLQGLPVLRADGEEIGMMDDLHFDPATGQITALQLSRGLVDDLLAGKSVVPLQGPVVAGEAAIVLGDPDDLAGGVMP